MSDQPQENHQIIPIDTNRGLSLPADMLKRGLKLAGKIESRLNIGQPNTPYLRFPGLLTSSCVSFSQNGEYAVLTSHGEQNDNPGLVVWNIINHTLSVYPEAGYKGESPAPFFVEKVTPYFTAATRDNDAISKTNICLSENIHKYVKDPASTVWDINCATLTSNGEFSFIGYCDGSIAICSITNGLIGKFEIFHKDEFGREVKSIAISPNYHLLAASIGGYIILWDVRLQKEITRIKANNPFYNQLSFSTDNSKLLVANFLPKNGWIEVPTIFDLTGKRYPVACVSDKSRYTSSVALSNDNYYLVSLDNSIITVWDATNGNEIRSWKHTIDNREFGQETNPQGPGSWGMSSISFSPDGKCILSGGADKYMRAWTIEGEMIAEYMHESQVVKVAFHPNGRQVLSGCFNGSIYIWDLPSKTM
jgi:WD40 repeat protein